MAANGVDPQLGLEGAVSIETLVNHAPGLMMVLSGPGHLIVAATAQFKSRLGRRRLVGRTAPEAMSGLDHAQWTTILDDVYRSGRSTVVRSVRFPKRDPAGSTPSADLSLEPIRSRDDRVIGMVLSGAEPRTPKPARRRGSAAEPPRTGSEMVRKTLGENSPEIVCRINMEGVFTEVSGPSEAHLGYAPEELVGRKFLDFVHPEDVERTTAAHGRILGGDATFDFENRYIRKDGSEAYLLWSSKWSAEGREVHAIARDLTESRRAHGQSIQAQKMQALGQLTGGIAHDFNNLMTIIIGDAEEIAEKSSDRPPVAALATEILTTADRATDLTHHLLAFARRRPLRLSYLRVAEVIDGVEPLVSRALPHGIRLTMEAAESDFSVMADRALLESAILNLALNAGDALRGQGSVEIRSIVRGALADEAPFALGQDVVSICVADDGPGIPPEVLPHIFEPFFSTKDAEGGTGLGLSMVYGFAQQSGGLVKVASTLGAGTRFEIVLPAVAAASPARGRRPDAPKVMVVGGERQGTDLLTARLLAQGYAVVAVSQGVDAMAAIMSGEEPDLIIAEMRPRQGLSGLDLLEGALRLRPSLRAILTHRRRDELALPASLRQRVALIPRSTPWNEVLSLIRQELARDAPSEETPGPSS